MPKFISTDWLVRVNNVEPLRPCVRRADHRREGADRRVGVLGHRPQGVPAGDRRIRPSRSRSCRTSPRRSVHATIWPLYEGGSSFPILVQPDSDAVRRRRTRPTRERLSASRTPSRERSNERAEVVVEFKPAPNSLFDWSSP